MFSKSANYNMDDALSEINDKKLLLDVKVETQVLLQLLVKKGIVTREEVADMRKTVRAQPQYKELYDYFDGAEKKAAYYKENPQEHLRDLMKAKLAGKDI